MGIDLLGRDEIAAEEGELVGIEGLLAVEDGLQVGYDYGGECGKGVSAGLDLRTETHGREGRGWRLCHIVDAE